MGKSHRKLPRLRKTRLPSHATQAFMRWLLGNGKGIGHLSFDSSLNFKLAGALLLFRLLVIVTSLPAGAAGGLLTPVSSPAQPLIRNICGGAVSLFVHSQ